MRLDLTSARGLWKRGGQLPALDVLAALSQSALNGLRFSGSGGHK